MSTDVPRADRLVSFVFRTWSTFYDHPLLQRPFYRRVHAAVLSAVDQAGHDPGVVLDIGCGTAQLTVDLAARFPRARVAGIDFSAGMLAAARRRMAGGGPPLLRANVYGLPVASGSADLVTSTISYHWYLEPQRALGEIHRVLRPGGAFVLATMVSFLFRGVVGPNRFVPPRVHLRDLRAAGFDVSDTTGVFPNVRVFTALKRS